LRALAANPLPEALAGLNLDGYERIILTGMGASLVAAHPTWSSMVAEGRPTWWVSTAQLLATPELVTPGSLLWVTSQSGESGEVEAKTAFLVYRSHLETDHQLLSGCREDVLRKVNGAWKVARRTIVLDANVLLDKNLSVFL